MSADNKYVLTNKTSTLPPVRLKTKSCWKYHKIHKHQWTSIRRQQLPNNSINSHPHECSLMVMVGVPRKDTQKNNIFKAHAD